MKHCLYLVLSIFITLFTGCTSLENPDTAGLGSIRFVATIDTDPQAQVNDLISLTLSSRDGQYSHTWSDINDFPILDPYYAGWYHAFAYAGSEPGSEGFDCASYVAETDFMVVSDQVVTVNLSCTLSQAMVHVDASADFLKAYPDASLTFHAADHGYITTSANDGRILFLMPGATSVSISLKAPDGHFVDIYTGLDFDTLAGSMNDILIDADGDVITISSPKHNVKIKVSHEIFDSLPPSIVCEGFEDGVDVHLTEGFPSHSPLIMLVNSDIPLASLMLTTIASVELPDDIAKECDLLSDHSLTARHSLKVDQADDGSISVNFTGFIESISVTDNASMSFTFILQARDILGRLSLPVTLNVRIQGVGLSVAEVHGAVIGIEKASVVLNVNVPVVEAGDFTVSTDPDDPLLIATPLPVDSVRIDSTAHTAEVFFAVPRGVTALPVIINYMEKTSAYAIIPRIVPQYRIVADPFAATARLRIVADDPEVVSAVTQLARIVANHSELGITDRNPQEGILVCAGLSPNTKYTLSSYVTLDGYVATTQFVTEEALQIVDGDFEDAGLSFSYNHLPSGGVYSSASFPIFNQQNFVDINVYFPKKHWASINEKTFSRASVNHNTWYMQPSAEIDFTQSAAGSKSMKISSVGWSLEGQELAPYVQEDGVFRPYSRTVPQRDRVSAGRLFLGTYNFNAKDLTEVYTEGVAFNSRPSSLNGYFKYIPQPDNINDCGWVSVQVINVDDSGVETVIAQGRQSLSDAPFFRSFNLPLVYDVYNMKASKVKIMFCSSIAADVITLDDPSVPVSTNISEARFTGSVLWIDNLSFSY